MVLTIVPVLRSTPAQKARVGRLSTDFDPKVSRKKAGLNKTTRPTTSKENLLDQTGNQSIKLC